MTVMTLAAPTKLRQSMAVLPGMRAAAVSREAYLGADRPLCDGGGVLPRTFPHGSTLPF